MAKKKHVIKLTAGAEQSRPIRVVFKDNGEVTKHRANIRTILTCSNATPIRRYGGVGYMCCFCPQQFRETAQLKQHTLQDHDESVRKTFMRNQTLQDFLVKLDITELACKLCRSPFTNLDAFTSHLVSTHNKTYHTEIKSRIMPFRFDSEYPRCVVCEKQYNNYKTLQQHMNMHFKNHVCDVCGQGFVTPKIFRKHMTRHTTGVFNCSYCPKVFDTRVKWRDHERAIHVLMNKRNKCAFCGEKFNDYAKKVTHEVMLHGVKPLVLNCVVCNKTFDSQRRLTAHKKSHQKTTKDLVQ